MKLGELKTKIDIALERFGPEARVIVQSGYTPGQSVPKLYLDWHEHRFVIDCDEPGETPPATWQEI